jgi:F-type H+-transporting ATPase subunit gamma
LLNLANQTGVSAATHPLLTEQGQAEAVGLILLTGDRGLCGAYNVNIVKTATNFIESQNKPVRVITVGRKGRDLMARRGHNIVAEFSNLPSSPSIMDTTPIAWAAIDDFLTGKVSQVCMAYTDFINTLRQEPTVKRLLPLRMEEVDTQAMGEYVEAVERGTWGEYIYEPSAQEIFEAVLPRFTELQVYQAILEALASEHSARMVAMRNASENAQVLIEDLTLSYNKARQTAITSEILDITGGAEALAAAKSKTHRA